ncbi:MAG TPA: anti-sigma F factor antagonist [Acholeplasmataceae bacterium]|nr:anti-sigma F factor antagonist [Acholeplasmataceae bacterium]
MTLKVEMFIKRHILYTRLMGELDQNSVENLRIRISELIDKYQIRHLVLNFEKLDFMDSSGVGFIIGRYKRIRQDNGEVILCSLNDNIRRIVMLSGLAKICVIKMDEDEVNKYLGVV